MASEQLPVYFTTSLPNDKTFLLEEAIVHHLRVRRELEPSFQFLLSSGNEFALCTLFPSKKAIYAQREEYQMVVKPARSLHLYPAILKKETMSLVVQKATEFGVSSITPLVSERVQQHLDQPAYQDHLRKVMQSAATQSHQLYLPELHPSQKINSLPWGNGDRWIVADFDGDIATPALFQQDKLSLLIGPEGGWSHQDRQSMPPSVTKIRLGSTVLRAETAAIACLALACCL